jgi:hypothetical protein
MHALNAKSKVSVLRRAGLLLLNIIKVGSSIYTYLSN